MDSHPLVQTPYYTPPQWMRHTQTTGPPGVEGVNPMRDQWAPNSHEERDGGMILCGLGHGQPGTPEPTLLLNPHFRPQASAPNGASNVMKAADPPLLAAFN